MAFFYNTETKQFPIYLGDAQVAYPDWDGDVENPPAPLVWVADVQVELVLDKVIQDAEPKQVNGVWTRQFTFRDLTDEEIERRDAPATAKAKLKALGLSDAEILALGSGFVR
jgi:hypothetical protein